MKDFDRRSFLKIASSSLGIGVLYTVAPAFAAGGPVGEMMDTLGKKNGEKVKPFSFVQLSDPHVGFEGPPNPLGTKAFEKAVEMVNGLTTQPELVIFTGDLTHDSEDKDVHSRRMQRFKEISSQLSAKKMVTVPGEHDAGLDGGALYRDFFGETFYSFDHRGVHFVALDNVSRAKPEVGPQQIEWLKKDLARFPRTAPIIVFTHRPLFDLKPEWEWFTSDGDDVMNVLSPYENVTVLYGHIHRDNEHEENHVHHFGARSLIFAFPDPDKVADKKPIPFDKEQPFKNLGCRVISEKSGRPNLQEVELTLREYSELNGIQQILRNPSL